MPGPASTASHDTLASKTWTPPPVSPDRSRRKCACGGEPSPSGECEECRKKRLLQRRASGPARSYIPPVVHDVLASPGRPLDTGTRAYFEPRFGHDFSAVRVHDDARAGESARAVNAHAYAVGDHIAFAPGRYDTNSSEGRHLLAHELAHTVQQRGLLRSAAETTMPASMEEGRLEREADHAANRVLSSPSGPVPSLGRSGRPVLSREPDGTGQPAPAPAAAVKENDPEYSPELVNGFGHWVRVRRMTADNLPKGGSPEVTSPNWELLNLRATPSKSSEYYIRGHLLNDNLGGSGNHWKNLTPLTSVANNRSSESHLHAFEKHVKIAVIENDKVVDFRVEARYGGGVAAFDESKLKTGTAHERETIKAIAQAEQLIPSRLECQAVEVDTGLTVDRKISKRAAKKGGNLSPKLSEVVMIENKPDRDPASYFLHTTKYAEYKKKTGAPAVAEPAAAPGTTEARRPYPVTAGPHSATIHVPESFFSGTAPQSVSLAVDPANLAATLFIPGLILESLQRSKGKGKGKKAADGDQLITGRVDDRDGVKLPFKATDKKNNQVVFSVAQSAGKAAALKIKSAPKEVAIWYPKLSPGAITGLKIGADGALDSKGYINTKIPFIQRLDFSYAAGELKVTKGLKPKELKSPISGFRVTRADIGLRLWPDLVPTGGLDFVFAVGGRKLLTGNLNAILEGGDFSATGELQAYPPGFGNEDEAKGRINYSKGVLTGLVEVKSTQLQKKIKYFKRGELTVRFGSEGIGATGKIELDVPRTKGVELTLDVNKKGWIFTGRGTVAVPRLGEIGIEITYDGNVFEGKVSPGPKFTLLGFNGSLDKIEYRNGRITGTGSLEFKKGKAKGKLKVNLLPNGNFSGSGELTYQISENLVVTGTAELDAKEKLRLSGTLKYLKPIEIPHTSFGGHKTLFKAGMSIPIPGLSLGPAVGVKVRIEGELNAGFQIGPAQVRNIEIKAMFSPLDEHPNPEVEGTAEFFMPAHAYIGGSISAGVMLDLFIGDVTGGLTVRLRADFDGHFLAGLKITFSSKRYTFDAKFELMLALALLIGLDAFLRARAGWGGFGVSTEKVWKLAEKKIDTGLKFGVRAPLHYASDEPFKAPSWDSLTFIKPDLDLSRLLGKALGDASKDERKRG